MAWLKQEGDFFWMVEKVKSADKKWKNREWSTGLKDKIAANKFCSDYNEDRARIKVGLSPLHKEAAQSRDWWAIFKRNSLDHARTSMKEKSQKKVRFVLENMEKLFNPKDLSLDEFKRMPIGAEYVEKRLAGQPAVRWCGTKKLKNRPVMISTARAEISFLSPLFERAIKKWEDIGITKNPFDGLKVAPRPGTKENKDDDDPKYLEYETILAFFAECRRRHGPAWEFAVQLYYFTGVRLDEARYIRREGVDLKDATIEVPGTKTRAAKRTVDLPEAFLPRVEEFMRTARPGFLLTKKDGSMMAYSTIQQRVKTAFTAIGYPWAHTHTLRHSYTSHRLENGDNILHVRDSVGHVNISTTNKYARRGVKKQQISLAPLPAEQAHQAA